MNKQKLLLAAILLAVGAGIGYFAKPAKVETKTVEVVKTQTKVEKGKTKVVYKTRIIHPDGTVEEIETTKEDSHSNTEAVTDSTKQSEITVTNRAGLTVQALAVSSFANLRQPEYGAYVSKRVVGNITVGVGAVPTLKLAIVGVGMEF